MKEIFQSKSKRRKTIKANRFFLVLLLAISVSITACKEKTDSNSNQSSAKTNAVMENKKIPKNAEKLFNEANELNKISSFKRAFEFYDKACKLKHGEACWKVGEMGSNYTNLDPAEQTEYAQKACDYGFAKSCWRVANHYISDCQ